MNRETDRFVQDFIQAWNNHDIEAATALCTADYTGMDIGESSSHHGPQGLSLSMTRYLSAFPDLLLSPLEIIAEGDRVALRWIARGTQQGWLMNIPPTGRSVTVTGTWFLQLSDGKIQRGTSIWDVAGLLRMIGLLPELA